MYTFWRRRNANQNFLGDANLRANYLDETLENDYYSEGVDVENVHEVFQYMEHVSGSDHNAHHVFREVTREGLRLSIPVDLNPAAFRFLDPLELIQFGRDALRMIRNSAGEVVGVLAIVPIHSGTLEHLRTRPISRHYFKTLSERELQECASPDRHPAGWFIYHLDLRKDSSQGARYEIM